MLVIIPQQAGLLYSGIHQINKMSTLYELINMFIAALCFKSINHAG